MQRTEIIVKSIDDAISETTFLICSSKKHQNQAYDSLNYCLFNCRFDAIKIAYEKNIVALEWLARTHSTKAIIHDSVRRVRARRARICSCHASEAISNDWNGRCKWINRIKLDFVWKNTEKVRFCRMWNRVFTVWFHIFENRFKHNVDNHLNGERKRDERKHWVALELCVPTSRRRLN